MLDAIRKKFSAAVAQPAATAEQEKISGGPPDRCSDCGRSRWWQRIGSDAWKCEVCLPPPTESFVQRRHGAEVEQRPVALETLTLQACLPICPQCGCQIYDETTYSDGRVEMRCVRPGCRAEVTGEPLRIPVIRSRGYCVTASTPTADRQAMAEKFQRWQAALGIEQKN